LILCGLSLSGLSRGFLGGLTGRLSRRWPLRWPTTGLEGRPLGWLFCGSLGGIFGRLVRRFSCGFPGGFSGRLPGGFPGGFPRGFPGGLSCGFLGGRTYVKVTPVVVPKGLAEAVGVRHRVSIAAAGIVIGIAVPGRYSRTKVRIVPGNVCVLVGITSIRRTQTDVVRGRPDRRILFRGVIVVAIEFLDLIAVLDVVVVIGPWFRELHVVADADAEVPAGGGPDGRPIVVLVLNAVRALVVDRSRRHVVLLISSSMLALVALSIVVVGVVVATVRYHDVSVEVEGQCGLCGLCGLCIPHWFWICTVPVPCGKLLRGGRR